MSMAETAKTNLNSILLMVTLGVLGWLGVTTQSTSVAVAGMASTLDSMAKEQGRTERDLLEIRARLNLLELQVAKLSPR